MVPKALLLFSVLSLLFAQEPVQAQKQSIGLQGGFLSSNLRIKDWKGNLDPGDKVPKFQRITNLYFSANYSFRLAGKFYLLTGLELYNRGSLMSIDSAYHDILGAGYREFHVDQLELLRYLMVPLVLTRRIELGKHVFSLHLGCGFNQLLRADYQNHMSITEMSMSGDTLSYVESRKGRSEGWKPRDFSFFFGGGYRYEFNQDFALGLEYRCLFNYQNINNHRLVNWFYDKQGNIQTHSPGIYNLENHAITLALYLSPAAFLGLDPDG